MPHFVIDHNFPVQATGLPWPSAIRLTRLVEVDSRLIAGCDDWEVFLELGRRGGVDGFITNDAKILRLPREMVVLSRSSLTLVVADGVGADPIRATGLVMVSLTQIVKQVMGAPQIFILRPPELGRTRTDPEHELTAISQHRNIPRAELVAAERQFLDTYRRRQPPL